MGVGMASSNASYVTPFIFLTPTKKNKKRLKRISDESHATRHTAAFPLTES